MQNAEVRKRHQSILQNGQRTLIHSLILKPEIKINYTIMSRADTSKLNLIKIVVLNYAMSSTAAINVTNFIIRFEYLINFMK